MGPLVPELISNELNYIVAIVIGFFFGFILEQAGFSTSKKLVGLFYGYDFTVLRVFFTAGVTAMIGVVALTHFGLLDSSLIYINPTFLWSGIVGGLIMGVGFILGGYCPGTSICGAAIGKIDAMLFVLGSFIGVYVFAEGYPWFESLYKASNWGQVRIFDTIGVSQGVFAFLLTFVAIFAFWAVSYVEARVNKTEIPKISSLKNYLALSALAIILGISTIAMPDKKDVLISEANNEKAINEFKPKLMTIDEFAFRIVDKDKNLQIIDLRDSKEFKELFLPNSYNFTLQNLFEKEADKILSIKDRKYVFVANDESSAKKGAYIASKLGYSNIFVLEKGMKSFKSEVLDFSPLAYDDATRKPSDRDRFLSVASLEIPKLIQIAKQSQNQGETKSKKRALGGC